ncbi:MAG: hypothetical protein R3E01_14340 [Pirellulaceae bacterium]|nr:hypothetical protein [Planctomycetales bacterium]
MQWARASNKEKEEQGRIALRQRISWMVMKVLIVALPGYQFMLVAMGVGAIILASISDVTNSAAATTTVDELIRRLDSASFIEREDASRQLQQCGAEAMEPLANAAVGPSREVATRALIILQVLAGNDDISVAALAAAALRRVADDPATCLPLLAKRICSKCEVRLRERYVRRFARLGAVVSMDHSNNVRIRFNKVWRGTDDDLQELFELFPPVSVNIEESSMGDNVVELLADATTLQDVYLGQSQATGKGLAEVCRLPRLRYLSLRGLRLREDAFAALATATSVQMLGLDETNITDAQLEHCGHLPNLNTLWLNSTAVSDEGLKHLAELPKLEKLYLTRLKLAGPGLEALKDVVSLRYLSLQEVPLSDSQASSLVHLKQLTTLGLDQTKISDEGLGFVAQLNNLETLWLDGTKVSDASCDEIAKLTKLKKLYLRQTKISTDGKRKIADAIKTCRIYYPNSDSTGDAMPQE